MGIAKLGNGVAKSGVLIGDTPKIISRIFGITKSVDDRFPAFDSELGPETNAGWERMGQQSSLVGAVGGSGVSLL